MPKTTLLDVIKAAPKTSAIQKDDKEYQSEKGLNAGYYDIEHAPLLTINENRIFALRGDMILATGIKQVDDQLKTKALGDSYKYIDPLNRYGHPTLAMPEGDYDGRVYYAGWVSQNKQQLTVFLASGRFQNDRLSAFQRTCIEIHIAKQFMDNYGRQNVIFVDFHKELDGFSIFLQNADFPRTFSQRTYTPAYIDSILKLKDFTPDNLVSQNKSTTHKIMRIAPAPTAVHEIRETKKTVAEAPRKMSFLDSLFIKRKASVKTTKIFVAEKPSSLNKSSF